MIRSIAVLLSVLVAAGIADAHEDVGKRIDSVSRELEANNADARLLLRHAELHAENDDWPAALHGYDLAAAADPDFIAVDFYRGRSLHLMGQVDGAENALNRFLHRAGHAQDTDLPTASAHLLLGELMEATGRLQQAVGHYDAGLRLAPGADPGFYIARARCLVNADSANLPRALEGLDERLKKAPGVLTLAEYAVELALAHGDFDDAATRLAGLIEAYPRLVGLRLRLAELHRDQGSDAEARRIYRKARQVIAGLPPHAQAKLARNGTTARVDSALGELR